MRQKSPRLFCIWVVNLSINSPRVGEIKSTAMSLSVQDREQRRRFEPFRQIQKSHTVCSNCLQIVEADRIDPASWRDSLEDILIPVYLHGEGANRPGQYKSYPPSCDNCGVPSVMETLRPLSKKQALRYGDNLSLTAEVIGIEHDTEVLLRTISRRKSTPKYARRDDETFGIALNTSLKHGTEDNIEALR